VKVNFALALLEGFGGELVIIAPFEGAAVPMDGKSRIKKKRRRPVTRKSTFLSLVTFFNEAVDLEVVPDRLLLHRYSISPPCISIDSFILFYKEHNNTMFFIAMIDNETLRVSCHALSCRYLTTDPSLAAQNIASLKLSRPSMLPCSRSSLADQSEY
jgi:hypothetical protein